MIACTAAFEKHPGKTTDLFPVFWNYGNAHFYKPGSFIHMPEDSRERIFFVRKGLVHVFTTKGGSRKTMWLCTDGGVICLLNRFFGSEHYQVCIRALEYTQLLEISGDRMAALQEDPATGFAITEAIAGYYYRLYGFFSGITGSAAGRYHHFQRYFSSIEARVPVQIIASLLDITPKTIRRMRCIVNKCSVPEPF